MTYRAELDGFHGFFKTVAELKVWAEDLNRRYGLKGKTLSVYKAEWVARDGSGACYSGKPHQIVVGA